jgi:hypothetical protein
MIDIVEEAEIDAARAEAKDFASTLATLLALIYQKGGGWALKGLLATRDWDEECQANYLLVAETLVARGLPRPAATVRKAAEPR